MRLNANIVGTDALLKKFKSFGQEGERKFVQVTKVAAEEIKEDAKSRVPVDTGKLRQSISSQKEEDISYKIYSAEPYAAYMEFGTGGSVDVPKGWEGLAAKFKGKGIKKINLPAQPYMYPAFKAGSKQYVKDLDKALDRLTIKFNKK